MNKIHSKVWNKELGQLVVASELASSDSAGVVQGAGTASVLRGSVLAAVVASLFALAGFGPAAFAQEWTVTDGTTPAVIGDGGAVTFQGDSNVSVTQTGEDGDAVLAITLDPDLVVDSVTTGNTVMDATGVAVGANVKLGSTGLVINGGPSVTTAGINAGNRVITNVASGTANDHAVNVGQLNVVNTAAAAAQSTASGAQTAASNAQSTADQAALAAQAAQTAADAAGAAWVLGDGASNLDIGPGGTVTFQGDGNISVALAGTDDNGTVTVTLDQNLTVTSITTGNSTLDNGGLTISGGPSVTSAGIDAGGLAITNLAEGALTADSNEAVTGSQIFDLFIEEGAGGVRYFRAASARADSEALGEESIAIGPETVAAGISSFAAGDSARTAETAEGAIALGQGATVGTEGAEDPDGIGSIAIGRNSQAAGNSTLAMGDGASVDSEHVDNATALGAGARVSGNFGTGGTAVGANAHASQGNATALGTNAQASGGSSIAVGQAHAAASSALAAGNGAYAGTTRGIALGSGAGVGTEGNEGGDRTDHIAIGTSSGTGVVGNQTTAIGYGAGQGVIGDDNVALGTQAGGGLQGNNNISIGTRANDGAGGRAQAIAIGHDTASGSDSVALGSGARAAGSETLALGKDSSAGSNGVAVGAHATAEGSNIALGRNSAARISDLAGSGYLTSEAAPGSAVSVGNSNPGEAFQRRIINVADGAQRYDAVNVGQLEGAQRAVANLVGGAVTVEPNGSFGGYVIELTDASGDTHRYTTVAAAINAVSSGDVSVLPGDAVIYNPDGTVTVAAGVLGNQAVNVEQLNEAIAESGVQYYSANTTIDANRQNDGATGDNAMAIGPSAVASGSSSLAAGHAARVNDGAHNGVAIGHDVSARSENATVLGNRSHTYDAGGVAIGQQAVSRGQNSIVMGTGAEADPKSGGTVNNAIVIGTVAEATADDGIAIGQSALASEARAVAQGHDAHAMATDSQASGTRARTTGVNSQASGTDAHASGTNAIATGTNSRGYATDGIAMGTGAISGFVVDIPGDQVRNHGAIAIGDTSRADDLNALALGVEAQARAESATAIGEGAVANEDAEDGLAVGSAARVTAQNASAFGQRAEATAIDALAVGSGARASGLNAAAFGRGAEASAQNASALGQGARALHQGSVALGSDAITAAPIGTTSISVDKNTYNFAGTSPVATVSVGNVGAERTITNVAAGRINATSTDAINGSQLHGTNQALEALADDLDTAGESIAAVLGGNAGYDPDTHQVTMSDVGGTGEDTVDDAIRYAAQGWNVSAEDGATANVAPGGTVDFSSSDGNIDISRDGTDLEFALADDLEIGNSITVGDTIINGDRVTTNNLTVGGETRLGDNFVVNNAGDVYYNGAEIATRDDGLSFAGNTGGTISRTLGHDTPLTISGGLAGSEASTGANLRVDSDGNQLNLVMARDLTDLDSITINNGGPVIDAGGIDMGGKQISNLADGTEDHHAVNLGQLKDVEDIANAGWNVSVDGEGAVAGNNVGPDGVVDFSNDDGNIEIDRTGTDLAFNLSDELEIGTSITVGDTFIDGDSITTTNLTVEGDTRLGDHFTVNEGGVYYGGPITEGDHIVNKTYVDGAVDDLANTPLTFAGDAGTSVDRLLGETVNLVGGATDETALTDGNIGVVADGDDTLAIKLNKDIDLGDDGSVAIGDTTVNNDGLEVTDADGNSSTVGAGSVAVTDGTGTTTIGGNEVSVGGANPIVISGDTGTIGGLTNRTWDPDNIVNGQAATEDQLGQVYEVASAGWNISAQGNNETNVVPGGSVDLNNADGNIVITKADDSNDVTFDLSDELEIGTSITVGDTFIDGDSITTTNLTVEGDTRLGDHFTVNEGGVYYGGPITEGDHIVNKTYVDGAVDDLAKTPLTFAGDAGTSVDRLLGETVNLVGGATDETALTDGNIGVVADGDDTLAIKLNKDIDLGDDGSVAIGDTTVNNEGLEVTDADGNSSTVGAGSVAVTDGTGTTTIGGSQVSVGGTHTIVIDGDAGTIGGLQNQSIDYPEFADGSGRAATEEQLAEVNETANAGWNLTGSGDNEVNIGPNGAVDFQGDDNITVAQTGVDQDGVIEITLNRDLDVDSVTAGDSVLDTDGLEVTDADGNVTTVAADGTTVEDDEGNVTTVAADGTTVTDAAGNSTAVGAGTVAVTDAGGNMTTIGGTEVSVGGANPIVIDGDAGMIGGLTNTDFDPDEVYTGGFAATQEQLSQVNNDLTAAGLNFVGDDTLNVHRELGETLSITGGADLDALSSGNIGVRRNADEDGLVIELADNIELTEDGSLAIGDGTDGSVLDADGLEVTDADGNSSTVGAGSVAVTDGTGTTTIGGNQVSVGGSNPIVISGDTGTIGGLTNRTWDPGDIVNGQAATEDQLGQVYEVANAGWNISAQGDNATNVGVNSDTGNAVDLNNADGNIVITKADDSNDVTFDLADDITVDSVTAGNSVLDTDGLAVTDADGNTTTVAADGTTVEDDEGNVTTVAADGTTVSDADGNSTAIGAGTVAVTDGTGTTTIGGNQVSVGGGHPIIISGDTGTIGGLQNQSIDYPEFADGSGRAATEEQLFQVNETANAGWNLSGSGEDQVNIGPNGAVDFQGDGNITVAQTGVDQDGVIEITLNRDLDVDSITAGDTFIDTTGVAIGADVHLGNTGLVITGGPSVTVGGIDAGNLVVTNVAPGEISATSTDAINGSQLHGMGDSIVNVIGGNAELNPDGTITTSDIGGTGHDNIDDAIRAANDAANAGWTATDADGNAANIGPNGTVNFTGDGNISVAQTGDDNSGEIQVTLNRDLDVDSITAGDTVIDTDGVRVGDDVHLGDTGLVIEGGPSVTIDGIDAGGQVISNVAAGVEDTDAANVGQIRQVAADVVDLGDRMDVVEGDVADLQAGATGPFQVSQEAPLVPPTPTGANSAAGGSGADASGDNATALGNQAVASGDNSTAVGQGAQATHDNSVALGQGSATTVGAQAGYDAAYVGSSDSAGEVNVGNRTISGVAPGMAGTDAVNVNQLNAGVNHAVVTANEYTDQRFNQVQGDVWHLHGRVDELEKNINSGVATAMAMRQAPYVAGATTYYAGFGAYKDQGALGISLRRTADNGRWSLEGGFSANRDGTGGYIGVSGVLGSK